MKKKYLVFCLIIGILLFAMPVKDVNAASDTMTVDVGKKMQKFDGWGTALAWWANIYGGHINIVDGQEQRKNITDMMFTDKGLNLNIARYNIGVPETPDNKDWDTVLNMPAYITGPDAEFDWSRDPRQLWVLEEFLRVQKNNPITEMWANTAPYWMTTSGTATGPVSNSENHISADAYDDYARYLVDILERFRQDKGIEFDYVSPVNEPNSGYAKYMGPHSGCIMKFGEPQSSLINSIYSELTARELNGRYGISGTDEISTAQTAYAWAMLDKDAKAALGKINTHTYSSNKTSQATLKTAAYGSTPNYENPNKKIWMSERTMYMGPEPEPFYYSIAMSQEIIDNIKIMGVNAWNHWQATDMLGINDQNTNWRYDMQFFTFGNFTRYITPGSRILNAGDDSTVAALTPDNRLVIVAVNGLTANSNLSDAAKDITIKVKNANVKSVDMVRTTPMSTGWERVNVAGSGSSFSDKLPVTSVTTYIFELQSSGCAGYSGMSAAAAILAVPALFVFSKKY